MSKLKFFILFFFTFQFAHAQSSKYFKKVFGLPSPAVEDGFSVKQLPAGDYIIAGTRLDNNTLKSDSYIVRTDIYGNLISEVFQPDSLANVYYGNLKLTNGGCLITGAYRKLNPSDQKSYLVKTDYNGDTLWTKKIPSNSTSSGDYCVQNTLGGGYIISGFQADSSLYNQGNVIAFNSSGNILWDSIYNGPYINLAIWIEQLQDSGYVFTGYTNLVLGSGDVWLKRLDKSGNQIWTQTYHCIGDYSSQANCLKKTFDNGFIICGYSGDGVSNNWGLIIKTDSSGNQQWIKKIKNENGVNVNSYLEKAMVLPDGSFIFCGDMLPTLFSNYYRFLLLNTDASGNTLWMRRYTQDQNFEAYAWDMDTTSDGGFIITGRMEGIANSDVYLVKTNCLGFTGPPVANYTVNSNGTTVTFINLSQRADTCIFYFGDGDSSITQLTDTIPVIHTYSTNGSYTVTLIVYACGESDTLHLSITTGIENTMLYDNTFKVQPNPAKDFITVDYFIPLSANNEELSLTNITGEEIKTFAISKGKQTTELNIQDICLGVYFLNLNIEGKIVCSRKLVVIKW